MPTEDTPPSLDEGANIQESTADPVTEHVIDSGSAPDKEAQSLKGLTTGGPDEKLKWLSGIIGISTAVLGSFTVFYDKVILPNTAQSASLLT